MKQTIMLICVDDNQQFRRQFEKVAKIINRYDICSDFHVEIISFEGVIELIAYIKQNPQQLADVAGTILFLDLNLNGYRSVDMLEDVRTCFKEYSEGILRICIVSSGDEFDIKGEPIHVYSKNGLTDTIEEQIIQLTRSRQFVEHVEPYDLDATTEMDTQWSTS